MTGKHKLAVAAAGAVVLAGAGTAFASGAGGHHPGSGFEQGRATQTRPGFGAPGLHGPRGFGFGFGVGRPGLGGGLLQAASSYLGVPVATLVGDLRSGQSLADVAGKTSGKSAADLIQALVADQKAQLDKAVAAGKLTQAQEDKVTANLQQRVTALVNGKRPAAPPRVGPRGFGGGLLQAASSYLGVPVATLVGDLRSGQSLADVAGKTSGKSAADLIQALVADQKGQLDKAVAAGKLTQAQEDKITANLQQRITALVNAKPSTGAFPRTHGRGFGFPGFGGGRHGGWATPPASGQTA